MRSLLWGNGLSPWNLVTVWRLYISRRIHSRACCLGIRLDSYPPIITSIRLNPWQHCCLVTGRFHIRYNRYKLMESIFGYICTLMAYLFHTWYDIHWTMTESLFGKATEGFTTSLYSMASTEWWLNSYLEQQIDGLPLPHMVWRRCQHFFDSDIKLQRVKTLQKDWVLAMVRSRSCCIATHRDANKLY